jgi:predicted DNA-binding transcriptional regulator AlpA
MRRRSDFFARELARLRESCSHSICFAVNEQSGVHRVRDSSGHQKHRKNPEQHGTNDPNRNDDLRVLSRRELIDLLGMSEQTFARLEARGEGPPKIRLSPRRIGYRVCDLKAWQDARLEKGAA